MVDLAARFQIPESVLAEVLQFLLDKGLLIKNGNHFKFGVDVIHVPHDSFLVSRHHINWRMKAIQINLTDEMEAKLLFPKAIAYTSSHGRRELFCPLSTLYTRVLICVPEPWEIQ